ncbi:MAG TPA: hypothetical protein VHM91_10120 [Verrucomicrobiales bacterium]|jgi:hypothetical protein|nr:hypothetical protein [Verrucomicrobiales bacterium]
MLPFPEENLEKIAEPPPSAVEHAVTWWWWAGAIVLGLILLGVLVWGVSILVRRASVPPIPPRPEKLALREIKQLKKNAGTLSAPEFGAALSGIVRSFLHRRAGVLARFATSQEILGTSRTAGQAPPAPLAAPFATVLESCDALKFGPETAAVREDLIAKTEAALNEVQDTLKHHLVPAIEAPPVSAPPTHATVS